MPNNNHSGDSQFQENTNLYDSSFYHQHEFSPSDEPQQPKEKNTKRQAPRMLAIVVAVSLLSGAAGGGLSYWLFGNASNQAAAMVQGPSVTVQQTPETPLISAQSTDVATVVQKASASVVAVNTSSGPGDFFFKYAQPDGAGSGVVLTQDGYIVTNNHVVENTTEITVTDQDGTEYPAVLIGTDVQTDLAVIKIEATGLVPATFADSDTIVVGEAVVAIGNSLGTLGGTVTNGIVSAKDRQITVGSQTMNLLQTSAAINPGNSGGGLFNAQGSLIGVVNAKSAGSSIEGLGFAIPSNTVRKVAEELMANGYVTGRTQLGISIVEVYDQMTAARYRVDKTGVYVAAISVDNGLEVGDRILSIDGNIVESGSDIRTVLDSHSVGDEVSLTVDRDGKEIKLSVTLTEMIPQSARQ